MCVYDTYAEDISNARTRTSKPQNHDSGSLERLADLANGVEWCLHLSAVIIILATRGAMDLLPSGKVTTDPLPFCLT